MSLITATDLAKSYGPVDIFNGVSLSIPHGSRIAIVGPNGIGKTTLLRILMGLEEPSAGTMHRARNLSVGYLPQEADAGRHAYPLAGMPGRAGGFARAGSRACAAWKTP